MTQAQFEKKMLKLPRLSSITFDRSFKDGKYFLSAIYIHRGRGECNFVRSYEDALSLYAKELNNV